MFGEVKEEKIWKEMTIELIYMLEEYEKKYKELFGQLSGLDSPNRIISVCRFGSYYLARALSLSLLIGKRM